MSKVHGRNWQAMKQGYRRPSETPSKVGNAKREQAAQRSLRDEADRFERTVQKATPRTER